MEVLSLEPLLSELDVSAQAAVWHSVHSTAVGDEQDLVTPLLPAGDPDEMREQLRDILFPRITRGNFPWLNSAEEEQAKKIGSYSIRLPYRERVSNVHSYFGVNRFQPNETVLAEAIDRVKAHMPSNLRVADLTLVGAKMPRGTNLGWPYFTSDVRYIPNVLQIAEGVRSNGFKKPLDPCLLFWRGQPRGIGLPSKNRSVWGYPHWLTALELQLQMPLLEHLRGDIRFAAWNNFDVIDAAISYAMRVNNKQKISVDFSSYDQTIHPRLIDGVEDCVLKAFESRYEKHISMSLKALDVYR